MPSPWSVPDVLLAAYRGAVSGSPPSCHLPVSLLAAIGQVESGSLAGRSLDATHRAVPPVLGPVLDGVSTAAISDTDGGRLDSNPRWDRAVGPMQFIPGSWAVFGVDADANGRADPQNVFDAAAAAAGYLCHGGRDLLLAPDLRSAILAYNHSTAYLATVLAWQHRFAASGSGATLVINEMPSTPTNFPDRVTVAASTAHPTVHRTVQRSATALPEGAATRTPSLPVLVRAADKRPRESERVFSTEPGPRATQPVPTATDESLPSDTSGSVTIPAAVPASVTLVSGSAQSATVGQPLTGRLVVQVTDVIGNPIPGSTVTFSAPAAGASGTFANGAATTTTFADANGRATSGALTANTTAGTYHLTASSGSAVATITETNSPGPATTFAIASAPVSGPASATAGLGPITVQLQDSYGNRVPAPNGGTPVLLSSDSCGTTVFATTVAGTSQTTMIIPSGESSVAFFYGDTLPGSPIITASGALTSTIQNETILVADATTNTADLANGP